MTIPKSGECALWWVWLRQKALLALAANLLGRLAVFVRSGPQDEEGETVLPNPHSHSSQSLRPRRLRAGEAARLLQEFGEATGAGCYGMLWCLVLRAGSGICCSCRWPPYARWAGSRNRGTLRLLITLLTRQITPSRRDSKRGLPCSLGRMSC